MEMTLPENQEGHFVCSFHYVKLGVVGMIEIYRKARFRAISPERGNVAKRQRGARRAWKYCFFQTSLLCNDPSVSLRSTAPLSGALWNCMNLKIPTTPNLSSISILHLTNYVYLWYYKLIYCANIIQKDEKSWEKLLSNPTAEIFSTGKTFGITVSSLSILQSVT